VLAYPIGYGTPPPVSSCHADRSWRRSRGATSQFAQLIQPRDHRSPERRIDVAHALEIQLQAVD